MWKTDPLKCLNRFNPLCDLVIQLSFYIHGYWYGNVFSFLLIVRKGKLAYYICRIQCFHHNYFLMVLLWVSYKTTQKKRGGVVNLGLNLETWYEQQSRTTELQLSELAWKYVLFGVHNVLLIWFSSQYFKNRWFLELSLWSIHKVHRCQITVIHLKLI